MSPLVSIVGSWTYMIILVFVLNSMHVYTDSSFFTYGPPVLFMGRTITSNTEYLAVIGLIFVHQLTNNWVNNTTYPWLLNSVQDTNSRKNPYGPVTTMLIINLFVVYSQLDVQVIVASANAQVVFVATIMLANLVASNAINIQYIRPRVEPAEETLIEV